MTDGDPRLGTFKKILEGSQSLSTPDKYWLEQHSKEILGGIDGDLKELTPLLSARLASIMRRRLDKQVEIKLEAHQEQEWADLASLVLIGAVALAVHANSSTEGIFNESIPIDKTEMLLAALATIATTKAAVFVREWVRKTLNDLHTMSNVGAAIEEGSDFTS